MKPKNSWSDFEVKSDRFSSQIRFWISIPASISISALPSAMILTAAYGRSFLLAALSIGLAASFVLALNRLIRIDFRSIRAVRILWPTIYASLCVCILTGMARTPDMSAYLTAASDSYLLVSAPFFALFFFTFLGTETTERRYLVQSLLRGGALAPIVMLVHDLFVGALPTLFGDFLQGVRLQNSSLVTSPNVNGVIGAFGFLCSFWLVIEGKRRFFLIGILAGIMYVMFSQSQGALGTMIASGLFMINGRLLSARAMRIALVIWAISAPVQIALYGSLNGTELGEKLTRVEAVYLGVGTGRSYVWTAAINEMLNAPFSYIIGTGFLSAANTSVQSAFQYVFMPGDSSDLFERAITLHNAALQYFFDFGIVGLALIFALMWKAIKVISDYEPRLNALIIFILFSGMNEATGAPYVQVVFWPFFAIIGAFAIISERSA